MGNLRAVTWKLSKECDIYMFQVTTSSKRALNKALKELGGMHTGQGYDPETDCTIAILQREFADKKSLLEFANGLSFSLTEVSQRTGKEKIINVKRNKKKQNKTKEG
jgi:hypothetical protein